MVQIGSAVDRPAIGAIGDDIRRLILVRKFAGDCLEHVDWRHQPLDGAEFVRNQHQLPP